MTLAWLVAATAGLALALPPLVQMYLERLPEAPACPTCRGVTRQMDECWTGHLFSWFSPTGLRACGRCGWHGRMRWRWAEEPARRGGRSD